MRTARDWRTSGLRTCHRCDELTEPGTRPHLSGFCSERCYWIAKWGLIPFLVISVGTFLLVLLVAWLTS